MRRIAAMAACFGLILHGQPASAEILRNFRLGGQFDMQATAAENILDFSTDANFGGTAQNDRIGDAQTRVMLFLDWDLLDDVHSHITLRKSDRTYGHTGGTTGVTGASAQTITATGGSNVLGNVVVDAANVRIDKVAGLVDMTVGRQFFNKGSGDIVMFYGPSDKARYGLTVDAIDAVRLDWDDEVFGITGIVAKEVGHAIGAATTADSDVRGFHVTFKGNDAWSGAAYLFNKVTHNVGADGAPPSNSSAGGKNDNLYVAGLRGRLTFGGLSLRAEFDKNFGENRQQGNSQTAAAAYYTGWAAQGNITYKLETDSMGAWTTWGEYTVGSGRSHSTSNINDGFTPIKPAYRPGSIWGRFASTALIGWNGLGGSVGSVTNQLTTPVATANINNRVIWGVGMKYTPGWATRLTTALSYWDFRLHRITALPRPGVASRAISFNGNRHIGSEVDLDFVWAHSEYVGIATGVAKFFPGGLIYEQYRLLRTAGVGQKGVNAAYLSYFDVRVRF